MPIEIDILEHSCDVVKLGSLLKTASIHFPLSVLISRDSAKLLRNLGLRSQSSLGRRQKKDTALARCRGGQRAWRDKKPVLSLSAVTDEEGHLLENEDESGRRLCEYWWTIFQAREEGPRHHQHEDILRYVQQAPDETSWTIDQAEFDDLLALMKNSAPGPDGIPHGACRCAGGLGSKFLFDAERTVLEGSAIPVCFAERRTVFIAKTSDTDYNGKTIRSPDALRPLTQSNCDCKLLTSAICRGLHWYIMRYMHPSQRCTSSEQMTDNIFEIETTALAHFSARIWGSLDWLCCCSSQCQSFLDLLGA